jgi:iron complex outermembrane recepter protein
LRRACLATLCLLIDASVSIADTQDRLDDVVVTARKTEENLQSVPISIAAFSPEQLRGQSIERISDLGQLTPNLFYGQKVQSGSSAGEIYIRGVGQGDTNATFSPSVGVYVDGVYFGRAQADDLDVADVERLEVLYGPQGSLFGKNTNGGAINIITRKPDPDAPATGSAEVDVGNYRQFDLIGRISSPLVANVAALSLSAVRRSQEGYSLRTDGERQANQNRTGIRAQLLLAFSEQLEAVLRLDRSEFNERSAAYRLVTVRSGSSIPMLYPNYDNRWVTASDFSYAGAGPNKNEGVSWGGSLTLIWKQPWGVLESISAYRGLHVQSDFDPDGSPLTILDVFNHIPQHQISQEFKASGGAWHERLRWVAGAWYFEEHARDLQPINLALELFQGAANFDPQTFILNRNYALYGQATLDLTSRLRLTAGGRLSRDAARVGLQHLGFPDPVVIQPLITRSAQWDSFLPRLSLDYQWTAALMSYVSAARGAKSGGFNGRAQTVAEFNEFEPERVTTYEVGLRSDWLESRLRFNLSAFYSQYDDFQILVNKTQTVDGRPVAFSFVGNMPRADIKGGELALNAILGPGWRVSAGLGVTDGRYREVIPNAPVDVHSAFIDTPKVTLGAGTEYRFGSWSAQLNYVHKSTIQFDYSNSPLVAQHPYGLLNGRITWEPAASDWSLFVFGTNLTNTHFAVGGIDDGPGGSLGEVVKMMGAPLEWGAGARYQF